MQSTILITHALKNKILFSNYEYDYVVGNGTMVCVDMVEVPLHGLYHPRIKLPMPSSDSSAVQIALTMRSIMALGKPVVSFPFCTPTDRRAGGVLEALPQ